MRPCAAAHPYPDSAEYNKQQCFVFIRGGSLSESEVYILQCFFHAFAFPVSVTFQSGATFERASWLQDSAAAAISGNVASSGGGG